MRALIKRHITLFLKDKMSVFFSLLSVFIIIGLYLLFLAENLTSNLPDFTGREAFVFLWMFAGIIAVTTATATLGALGKFIEDKISKKMEDFLITKITPRKLAYSYIMYTFIIGLIFTILLTIFVMLFDDSLIVTVELIAIVFLSTLMHTLLFYLITSYIKSMSAFSGFSTIVGTMIGFLAGIYIPIGVLPSYIQKVITIFPTTQAATLLKQNLMVDVLESMQTMMPTEAYEETVVMLGIKLHWNNQILSAKFSWLYLIVITIILLVVVLFKKGK